MRPPLRIAITTGDPDGIGSEVACKALARIGPTAGAQFLLWTSPQIPKKHLRLLDGKFKRKTVTQWSDALPLLSDDRKRLIEIRSHLPPPIWVEQCAQAALHGHLQALATAPLSKTSIADAGLSDIGHTDILKRVCGAKRVFMGFAGQRFNVVLASGHVPVREVAARLSADQLLAAMQAAALLRRFLKRSLQKLPVALVGLNPHAGESGLLGDEELTAHRSALESARRAGLACEGPLVPDAAFFKANWRKFSVYVANYHDQGLIPFKMVHGQRSGLQISLGLPMVRTSVDHGTAKDIFGKNIADASSMRLAIEWALRLGARHDEFKHLS